MNPPQDTQDSAEATPTVPVRAPAAGARWAAAAVLLACLSLLGSAAWLKPDPRGYGTHEQFHWGRYLTGPCGWMTVTGYPCPTCGMTTAFAHTVRLQWVRAFLAQPAGFVLALGTVAGALGAFYVLITGRWPLRLAMALSPYRVFLGLLVLLLGGWAFKIAAGLLARTLPVPWPR